MQLFKLLATIAAVCSLTVAAPVDITDSKPRKCGYVRLHEGDGYIVGIYSRGTCEPIWQEQEATLFRIDTAGCSCKFFSSKESCEKADPVQSFTGPTSAESRFHGAKPTLQMGERSDESAMYGPMYEIPGWSDAGIDRST